VFGVQRNRLQGFGGGPEQQTIHLPFVLEGQRSPRLGQSEDNVAVLAWQHFGLTLFPPLGSGEGLAPGAMPIGARVAGITFVPALLTLFEMPAQRSGTARFDGAQYTLLSDGQRFGMRLAELIAIRAHHVGDFACGTHERQRPWGGGWSTGLGSRSNGLAVAQIVVVARPR
jgi:hypothetical protein